MLGAAKPVRADGELVHLPILAGFPPNNNASPTQSTDAGGNYAYMVYPEADYYLVVKKPGYYTYTSPILSVEWDIVSHDIQLTPIPVPPTAPQQPNVPETPQASDVSVNIQLENNKYGEGTTARVQVIYINHADRNPVSGQVRAIVPEGATVVDPAGGQVTGNEIVWDVKDLAPNQPVKRVITLQFGEIDAAEKQLEVVAAFQGANETEPGQYASASVKLLVFSNRYGAVEHIRYILGYPDGLFKPERTLSRAELAAIIARLTNGGGTSGKANYADVPAGHWASGYIHIVTEQNLFTGYPDGTFRPENPVTREEIATVMVKFLQLQASRPIEAQYADLAGRWSAAAIEALFRNGMISGYPDGSFRPQNKVTRLEAVTLINRLLFRGPLTNVPASFPDVPADNWGFGQVEEATRSHEATRNADGSEAFVRQVEDRVQ